MAKLADFLKSTSKEVEILKDDIGIFKNLIKERKHPLDLVRELLSNAGAKQVGARKIEISYTKDREGHIFEVFDDGCGMNFTGSQEMPGRLDKFLGLGLSAISGKESDEFSWKGLGSKLAYQSRRIEIETRFKDHPHLYEVKVNEPWSSLDRGLLPKPRVTEHEHPDEAHHTRIKVLGHPPHRQEEPFTLDEIRSFLLHRTFVGFTRPRENPPAVQLTVMGNSVPLPFGFPEFQGIDWPDGIRLDVEHRTLSVNMGPVSAKSMTVRLKGFLTWDSQRYGLSKNNLNTGLIFSCKGIPYFQVKLDDYGATGIAHANPGEEKTCLVVECDQLSSEMNISRSNLTDTAVTAEFRKTLRGIFDRLEGAKEYLEFRQLPKKARHEATGELLAKEKRQIERDDQTWVVYQREGQKPLVLMREPANETEVTALVWKLEALGALPFEKFQTLAYPGASGGPDLFVNFQEEKASEPTRCAVVEVENNFYTYKPHGHHPPQYPKVICWDIPTSGRKVQVRKTGKAYKFTVTTDEYQVHIYALKHMPGIAVLTRRELGEAGVEI